jgi:glycosyltransferase involved in cell wall biosynthesis
MRFLFTTSFYPPFHVGGACTHVKYLAEALAERGHEVHVLYSKDAYRFKRSEKRRPEPEGKVILHELNSPLGRLEPVLNFTFGTRKHTSRAFQQLVKSHDFDVVHHHNISLLGYGILNKIGQYRNIYTAHDYWLICHKYDYSVDGRVCHNRHNCLACSIRHRMPYQMFRNSRAFAKAVSDIDLIITPSVFMAEILRRRLKNQIIDIPNLVPPWGRQKEVPRDYFLFVGQLEHHKGILQLVDAFRNLKERLVIVGTGSLEREVRSAAAANSNIELAGWKGKSELAGLYAGAKALIIPSMWAENYPTVAIEAMQFGTPVISTDLGGTKEIVSLIDKDLVFPADDWKLLTTIIRDFRMRDYPAATVRSAYAKHFTPSRYLKAYLKSLRL